MSDRIARKVRNASLLFFALLVACIFVIGLAVERFGAGDRSLGLILLVVGLGGFAWTMLQRYGNDGVYNPSRIHRREKSR